MNAKLTIVRLGARQERWNRETFALKGAALMLAIHRTSRYVQHTEGARLARVVAKYLNQQIEDIVKLAAELHARAGAKAVELTALSDEAIWAEAIRQVLQEVDESVEVKLIPPLTSARAQAYSKTATILGDAPDSNAYAPIASREARNVAKQIVGLTETTRKRIETIIRDAVDEGLDVADTARKIMKKLPQQNASRAMTIARTEMNTAWSEAAGRAFRENGQIKELSVIGCTSREVELWGKPYYHWLYRGESTCNYRDLGMGELDAFLEVGWHPNHGGTLVPSAFF